MEIQWNSHKLRFCTCFWTLDNLEKAFWRTCLCMLALKHKLQCLENKTETNVTDKAPFPKQRGSSPPLRRLFGSHHYQHGQEANWRNLAPLCTSSIISSRTLPYYVQGFVHRRWLFGISSINMIRISTSSCRRISAGSSATGNPGLVASAFKSTSSDSIEWVKQPRSTKHGILQTGQHFEGFKS